MYLEYSVIANGVQRSAAISSQWFTFFRKHCLIHWYSINLILIGVRMGNEDSPKHR